MAQSDERIFEFLRLYRCKAWHFGWSGRYPSPAHVLCGDGTLHGASQARGRIPDGGYLCAECRDELERRCRVKIEEVA